MKSARGRGIGFIGSAESDERGAGADGESQPRRQGKTCVFAKKQKPAAPRHLSGAVVLVRHVLDDHHPGIKPVQSARHRGVVTETAGTRVGVLRDVKTKRFVSTHLLPPSLCVVARRARLGAQAARRRLEQASGFEHRPLQALSDRMAEGVGDEHAEALWRLHLARMAEAARRIRVGMPHPGVAARDPNVRSNPATASICVSSLLRTLRLSRHGSGMGVRKRSRALAGWQSSTRRTSAWSGR